MTQQQKDFGEWLHTRAKERGGAGAPDTVTERGWSVELLVAGVVVVMTLLSVIGSMALERYSIMRDVLQIGAGLAAVLLGFIGCVLVVFAAVRDALGRHWKWWCVVIVVGMIAGVLNAGRELDAKARDKEARLRGEPAPEYEKALRQRP